MDLQILETGNGGDSQLLGNDFATVTGVENMPYLSMFGGTNFWGNDLLFNSDDLRFLAETEATLLTTPLNSQGRIIIENAVKRDLAFLLADIPETKLNVSVTIISDNKLSIYINFGGFQFYFLWNPVTKTLTQTITPSRHYVTEGGEDYVTEDGEIYITE